VKPGWLILTALTAFLLAWLVGFAAFKTYQASHQMCGGGAQNCTRPSAAIRNQVPGN
jgi:hypothetical protein